jgi:hypothetical protein
MKTDCDEADDGQQAAQEASSSTGSLWHGHFFMNTVTLSY